VVAADQDAVCQDLGRQMAVADLPGQGQQMAGVMAAHFVKRFRRSADLDDAAIVEDEPVAMAQQPRLGEVEQELDAVVGDHLHAPPVARGLVQRDGARGIVEMAGNGGGCRHGRDITSEFPRYASAAKRAGREISRPAGFCR
jgi:hypothetical protein